MNHKPLFVPIRPAIVERYNGVPKTWICNLRKTHNASALIVNGDSPDKMTTVLECFCIECVEFDTELYRISRPVLVGGFPKQLLEKEFVGIWFTRRGWNQYNR